MTHTKEHYLLLARQLHNEKADYHPLSPRFGELQRKVSELTRKAYELDGMLDADDAGTDYEGK